ncbi:dicarboxylate transporter/tellurite-resistance protein TehA [Lysobacter niastensis]|uniref:Dicarboxylate transporter/tellurite-resistance protein TehA n=1 Tax=Lysobacter niastensis TaxID=380629 RepID=A0ABS0BEF8_9GAMM|nr:dicarboxylate transporter/tellurite-resistance protein TehA [Lysobacter niastensis]MBF6025394.1 dicarboxylate transporter/tellurite-resistance protein TehA [Lysobacter niastensis]
MRAIAPPASLFGAVLGIVGLGASWRAAAVLWNVPTTIGESIMVAGAIVWAILAMSYLLKWLLQREEALAELRHPIQCCYISLVPATTTLMGLVLAPHYRGTAVVLWIVGTVCQIGFAAYRAGGLWRGGLNIEAVTPILFLPSVAANLISSIVAGVLGLTSWGLLFFGMGFFSWIVIESAIVFRLWTAAPLPMPLRPALGIHMAPPVVASVAYLVNTDGPADLFVQAMWGYGLLQLVMLARLLPWVSDQPFSVSYWGYSFGVTAISTGALQMASRGGSEAISVLAPLVFVISNAAIAALGVGTLTRIVQGRLLPPRLTGERTVKEAPP